MSCQAKKLLFSQLRYGSFLNKILFKQESMPLECVPPAFLVPSLPPSPGCIPPPLGHVTCDAVMHAGKPTPLPPVDRQTPVNTLPCPKLRLRAVKLVDNI